MNLMLKGPIDERVPSLACSTMSAQDVNNRFDSQLSRVKCQTFSISVSSSERETYLGDAHSKRFQLT